METSPRYVVFWMTTVLLLEFVAVNFIHFDIDRLGSASPPLRHYFKCGVSVGSGLPSFFPSAQVADHGVE